MRLRMNKAIESIMMGLFLITVGAFYTYVGHTLEPALLFILGGMFVGAGAVVPE